jgi:hypothetical protein
MIAETVLAVALMQGVVSQEACNHPDAPSTTPMVIQSGAPPLVIWTMEPTVPASTTDPTPVPNRYNGFYIQVDTAPRLDIGLPQAGAACPAGSLRAGDIPFAYRMPQGFSRGNHTMIVTTWNFAVDDLGNPTTTKQEAATAAIPFVVVDPILRGAPGKPVSPIIKR